MSLLGNHDNEFEKKLKKHLGDTEYKPAESLWDRIDQEVNRPPFEHKVEGKIGRYELAPKPETWEYIEAHLPPEPRSWKRAGKIWYGLVVLLFIGGAFIGYQLNESGTGELAQVQPAQETTWSEAPARANQEGTENTVSQKNTESTRLQSTGNKELLSNNSNQAGASSFVNVEPQTARSTSPQRTSTKKVITPDQKFAAETGERIPAHSEIKTNNSASLITPEPGAGAIVSSNRQALVSGSTATNGVDRNIPNTSEPKTSAPALLAPVNPENTATAKDHEPEPVNTSQAEITTGHEPKQTIIITAPVNQPGDTASNSMDTGKPIAQANDSMNRLPFAGSDNQAPVRLSISILAGMHQNHMKLVAPANMQANKALRQQVESPELDFTGGFLLDYQVSERVLISSGVIITGFTMGMNYDATPSGRSADVKPGATYQNQGDTITAGNLLSNRIKYSWTEIPLFVTYRFTPQKRLGIEVRAGISYAIIGTVDASMVGQDNIGVLVMKSQESFPVFTNSLFAQAYAGISYKLNETVSLNAMPYFKYSLTSMIKSENWVQQYPWMVGMSLGLRKSF